MTELKITEAITVPFPMVQFRARSGRSRLQDGEGRPQGAPLQAAALDVSRRAAGLRSADEPSPLQILPVMLGFISARVTPS